MLIPLLSEEVESVDDVFEFEFSSVDVEFEFELLINLFDNKTLRASRTAGWNDGWIVSCPLRVRHLDSDTM